MPLDRDQMREYQRQRRAKLAPPAPVKKGDPNALDQVHPVTGKRYTSDGARTGDGLPDTSVLIQRMTQHDRDVILARLAPPRRGA